MVKKKKGVPRLKPKKHAAPNMFERLSNKKRFDVLGRKSKGDVRNVNKLRSEATEKRKGTLLVEYRQLRKSNAFVDRRFGEDDETLTPDERNLLRFQKQRQRELAGSKFALPDEDAGGADEEPLTHLGRSLAELDDMHQGWASDDDDAGFDKRMDEQMTRDLHFGGGFLPSKSSREVSGGGAAEGDDGDEDPTRRKSKKEVMEEIIAKSKMHKAVKAQQKEEDVVALEKLDNAWAELTQGGALASLMRPKGMRGKAPAGGGDGGDDGEDRRFDVLTREFVFEAKAQPGERTLTADELADLERHRLEELEKQRVKRQRVDIDIGGDDLEDDFGGGGSADEKDVDVPLGGYAARRAKRAKLAAERATKRGSSDEDDSDGSDDSEDDDDDIEGGTELEQRRKNRAAGDHPLQNAFRDVAAKLLAKHGLVVDEEDLDVEEGEEDDDDDNSDDSDDVDDDDEEEDDEEEELVEEEHYDHHKRKKETAQLLPPASVKEQQQQEEEEDEADMPIDGTMTFTPALPQTYQAFSTMVAGLSAADLGEMLRRIRAFNAAALSIDGRKKTQTLYGCIVQHYVISAAAVPLRMDVLDAMLPHILDLTPQVPFYAATLARTRLQRAQQQMAKRLKDPVLRATAWPAPKIMMLLKLLTTVYPVSDKRHPVLTPVSLLTSAALELCPIARPRDVASGLFLASLSVHMHAASQRFSPEPLQFAVKVLQTAVVRGSGGGSGEDATTTTTTPARRKNGKKKGGDEVDFVDFDEEAPRWLALTPQECGSSSTAPATVEDIKELSVQRVFGSEDEDDVAHLSSPEFKSAAAASAVRLIQRIAASISSVDALPEIMGPAVVVLQSLVRAGAQTANGGGAHKSKKKKAAKSSPAHDTMSVAPGVAALAGNVLAEVQSAVAAVQSRRRPLLSTFMVAVPETRQFNPRYEDHFATGKDYDPDRERADRKRLQKELRREERGAARELRRDAVFMAGVRDKEKAALQGELESSAKRAFSFLQEQQADAKSGGQGGMWKKKRK